MEETNNTTTVNEATKETTQDTTQTAAKSQTEAAQEKTITIEELQAENAKERVEKERTKSALDKALKEIADLKKAAKQRMTAQEQEDEAKREEENRKNEEFERLREFERKTLAKDRYLMQGMTAEMATKAAEAEVSGDMDNLSLIQKQYTDSLLKMKEAEWLQSRPQAQVGTGEYSNMTKEEIMAIKDMAERHKAIAQNMNLFN